MVGVTKGTRRHHLNIRQLVRAIDTPYDFNISDNSLKRPVAKNVVFKAHILREGEEINLYDLPNRLFAQYDPSKFALAIFPRYDFRSTALLPASGSNVRVGCTSVAAALIACHMDRRDLQRLGYATTFESTHVENNVVACEVDFNVDLPRMFSENQSVITYEPSKFPGAAFQPYLDQSWKIVIFDSGKFNIMGFKKSEILPQLVTLAVDLMSRYRMNAALPPVNQRHNWRKENRYQAMEQYASAWNNTQSIDNILKTISSNAAAAAATSNTSATSTRPNIVTLPIDGVQRK